MLIRAPLLYLLSLLAVVGLAEEPRSEYPFLKFVHQQAEELRKEHTAAPESKEAWEAARAEIRRQLLSAWGGFPSEPCPLDVQKLGDLDRDGYRIEKLMFQTRPGIWMTAHAYVPKGEGKFPAVLNVHGHWREAKQSPQVQARCLGLVKLGFLVLAVDAFGAGERAVGEALGEYHGEMTAATLWPVGLPLSGLQVYENMRAVDYLQSRPDVDAANIGITGASGGGNQSMYAGAWDERLKAVVPVCSVGTYDAYLGAACCMCEVVPGALRFSGEGDILGLVAPRGLMVISATRDAFQFSVGEARKSLHYAQPVFVHYGQPMQEQHAVFESPHDYNRQMREAMYGWMTLQLKGQGDGAPIADPEHTTEDPESLRCFPGDTRPDDWVTLPQFAAAEAKKLLAARGCQPASASEWRHTKAAMLEQLQIGVLAGGPAGNTALHPQDFAAKDGQPRTITFDSEPGIRIAVTIYEPDQPSGKFAVLAQFDPAEQPQVEAFTKEFLQAGWSVALPELRATGATSYDGDKIANTPDHNTSEWALWIGRPMLGQWVRDLRRTLDALAACDEPNQEYALVGVASAGPAALCTAAVDERLARVATIDSLASYVCDVPYRRQRLGIMAPGILRDVGDLPHIAALAAPRRMVISGGRHGSGRELNAEEIRDNYEFTRAAFASIEAGDSLQVVDGADAAAIVRKLLDTE